MKFTSWLPGLAVFAVFCFSLISCLPSGSGVGEDMPEIHLPDLTDKLVSLGSFKGQVIMLNLWATWCPPCRSEIPDFIDLQNKYGADGLTIVAISLDTTGLEEVQDFCEKNKVNYPVLYAGEQGGEVMEKFGVQENFDSSKMTEDEEKALSAAAERVETTAPALARADDYAGLLKAIVGLKPAVDRFFDHVLVDDPDPAVKANRLALLTRVSRLFDQVADFTKITT